MAMILDQAPSISAPPSLFLFDDSAGTTVWFAAKDWRLHTISGKPAISYYENKSADIAFLQMIFAPWYEKTEYDDVKMRAAALGRSLNPVRYLGKSDSGKVETKIEALLAIPDDGMLRCQVNGGKGGFMDTPIPMVFNMNYLTGQIVKDMLSKGNLGLVFQYSAVIRGATSTFEADIFVDYDRTYEKLAIHNSWNWWIWSGDIQAAWQTLVESGAVKVQILGGTSDQKTIVYKMAEVLRDLFFKPTLAPITSPSHPGSGIINTSLQYEKIHEHKTIKVEFREREFTDAPYVCAAFTGPQTVAAIAIDNDPMMSSLLEMAVGVPLLARSEVVSSTVLTTLSLVPTLRSLIAPEKLES